MELQSITASIMRRTAVIIIVLLIIGCSHYPTPGAGLRMQRLQHKWKAEDQHRLLEYRIRAIEMRAREEAIGRNFPDVAARY